MICSSIGSSAQPSACSSDRPLPVHLPRPARADEQRRIAGSAHSAGPWIVAPGGGARRVSTISCTSAPSSVTEPRRARRRVGRVSPAAGETPAPGTQTADAQRHQLDLRGRRGSRSAPRGPSRSASRSSRGRERRSRRPARRRPPARRTVRCSAARGACVHAIHRCVEFVARPAGPSACALARAAAPGRSATSRTAESVVRRPGGGAAPASPKADEHAPEARGQTTRPIESCSATAVACSGPAPPNGMQRERSRVDAPLDGHQPERAEHLCLGDADDPLAQARASSPSSAASPAMARRARSRSSRTPPARPCRRESAEQQVGVGDGRPISAASVTGWARHRSRRRAGRRAERRRVAPGDRAAAGPDCLDVERRKRERTLRDLALRRLADGAVLDHADVARSAAHVEADHVRLARELGHRSGSRRRRRRAPRAPSRGVAGGRRGSSGPPADCMIDGSGSPAAAQRSASGAGSAPSRGVQRGVDRGRRRPFVLAERPDGLARERDGDRPAAASRSVAQRRSCAGWRVGVQERHSDGLGLRGGDRGRRAGLGGRQRLEHRPPGRSARPRRSAAAGDERLARPATSSR